jgi:rod shape-determining protein MreC
MKTLKRRILDYGLAGLLLLVPCVILYAGLKQPERRNGFDQAVLRISSPIQAACSWVIEGFGSIWNNYVVLVDVEDENDELRKENERLRRELGAARRAAADARQLGSLVKLKEHTNAETVGARIVSASVNPHFRVLRLKLDRGEGSVQPGMPVIVADGLVGRIETVYGDYSDVLLATDPQSSIDVVIPRTGGRGVLTGLAKDDAYRAEIEYLERDKAVRQGDEVVTSGLGGSLPAGITVGKIAAVNTKEYGLYQEVEVQSSVDFSALELVLVVLAPPPPADPDAGRRTKSPPAFGAKPF